MLTAAKGDLANYKGAHVSREGRGSCGVCGAEHAGKELQPDWEDAGGGEALCAAFLAMAAVEENHAAHLDPPTEVRGGAGGSKHKGWAAGLLGAGPCQAALRCGAICGRQLRRSAGLEAARAWH